MDGHFDDDDDDDGYHIHTVMIKMIRNTVHDIISYCIIRAQGRRLGIPSGSPAGGGGPGARERAARARDLS